MHKKLAAYYTVVNKQLYRRDSSHASKKFRLVLRGYNLQNLFLPESTLFPYSFTDFHEKNKL